MVSTRPYGFHAPFGTPPLAARPVAQAVSSARRLRASAWRCEALACKRLALIAACGAGLAASESKATRNVSICSATTHATPPENYTQPVSFKKPLWRSEPVGPRSDGRRIAEQRLFMPIHPNGRVQQLRTSSIKVVLEVMELWLPTCCRRGPEYARTRSV